VSRPANPTRGMRTAQARTPWEASASSVVTDRARSATGPSMGSGSASVACLPATHGVPETVTIGRRLPTSSAPDAPIAALSTVMAAESPEGLLSRWSKARLITPSAFAALVRRTSRSANPPRTTSAPLSARVRADSSERANASTECPWASRSSRSATRARRPSSPPP
jgi:hypothetical protein